MKTLAVLMPAYNAGAYIRDGINSILDQTYKEFELYIYDDCSTDDTEQIIAEYKDSRIYYRKNNTNLGIAKTLNKGLKELLPHYRYIARMDADDWSFPNRFELQLEALNKDTELIMVGTQGFWLPMLNSHPTIMWKYPTNYLTLKLNLLFSASFGHSSVIIKSEFLINQNLAYNESLKTCEDWELWCRILKRGKAINLPEFLMKYRTLPNSNHRTRANRNILLSEKCKVIQKCWLNFGFVLSDFEIYQFYYNYERLKKKDFLIILKVFVQLFNQLALKEFKEMETPDKNFIKYRFVRNILTYWKNSKISRSNISIWLFLFREVRFTSKLKLIKNLVR